MEQLAAAVKIRSGLLGGVGRRIVWTYGDRVDKLSRQVLTGVHAAPLRNLYSLDEFGSLAWECPDAPGTYHVNQEGVVVERADDGALVMTNLINRAMVTEKPRGSGAVTEVMFPAASCALTVWLPCGSTTRFRPTPRS